MYLVRAKNMQFHESMNYIYVVISSIQGYKMLYCGKVPQGSRGSRSVNWHGYPGEYDSEGLLPWLSDSCLGPACQKHCEPPNRHTVSI